MKVEIAFAAVTASPLIKVSAVGPDEQLVEALGAGLLGGALGEPVLDDVEDGVGLAQLARAARRPAGR